jgi:hypothetical protein
MDLNPVKSYNMSVLQTLLALPGTTWEISSIARSFKEFYLKNPTKHHDYDELDKSVHPEDFPLARVSPKLKSMPLHFLSNTDKDFFILDKKAEMFRLKDECIPFWRDETFRKLLLERAEFTLACHFQQRPKLFPDR